MKVIDQKEAARLTEDREYECLILLLFNIKYKFGGNWECNIFGS